jgi:hypothetical protein
VSNAAYEKNKIGLCLDIRLESFGTTLRQLEAPPELNEMKNKRHTESREKILL